MCPLKWCKITALTQTLGGMSMDKRIVITIYSAAWIAITVGLVYGFVLVGYPWWFGLIAAYLLLFFGAGSLAYMIRARIERHAGRTPPPYLKYVFFPAGVPKFKDVEAPRLTQVFAGILAALLGMFLVGCCIALAVDAYSPRMSAPLAAVIILLVLMGIGISLLYVGWRLIVPEKRPPSDAA